MKVCNCFLSSRRCTRYFMPPKEGQFTYILWLKILKLTNCIFTKSGTWAGPTRQAWDFFFFPKVILFLVFPFYSVVSFFVPRYSRESWNLVSHSHRFSFSCCPSPSSERTLLEHAQSSFSNSGRAQARWSCSPPVVVSRVVKSGPAGSQKCAALLDLKMALVPWHQLATLPPVSTDAPRCTVGEIGRISSTLSSVCNSMAKKWNSHCSKSLKRRQFCY